MAKSNLNTWLDEPEKLWHNYKKRLKACRKNQTEDNVHSLRTGIRRLLALIQLLQVLTPCPKLKCVRRHLKQRLDSLDALRDVQVMLFETALLLPRLPELEPFLAFLHYCEQDLQQVCAAQLADQISPKLTRKLKKACAFYKRNLAATTLEELLFPTIDKLFAEALRRYRALEPNDVASMHGLRITIKKLRYVLESVAPLHTDLPTNLVAIKAYLATMGNIQNGVVIRKALADFFGAHGIPSAIDHHFDAQQNAQIGEFMALSTGILGFWREIELADPPPPDKRHR